MQSDETYTGLRSEFSRASRNLCAYAIPPDAWILVVGMPWSMLSYEEEDETHHFPVEGSAEEILNFIDEYLFVCLLPKEIDPRHRNDVPYIRADLNKYRGWLLNRVLLDVLIHADPVRTEQAYRLPEDFSKLIDDVYLFHRHAQTLGADISQYKHLGDLSKAVDRYRIDHPILAKERAYAHAQYLEAEPEILKNLLPAGWSADHHAFVAPDGEQGRRHGGARLIAVLEDGTEVIHLRSEQASLAYGSPRWCTAYRNERTAFGSYDDGLIVVINPDGARWQIHFASGQLADANDRMIALDKLETRFPDLRLSLKKYLAGILERDADKGLSKSDSGFMFAVVAFPELIDEVEPKLIKQAIKNTLTDFGIEDHAWYGMHKNMLPAYWRPHLWKKSRNFSSNSRIIIMIRLWEHASLASDPDTVSALNAVADRYWDKQSPETNAANPVSPAQLLTVLGLYSHSLTDISGICDVCGISDPKTTRALFSLLIRTQGPMGEKLIHRIIETAMQPSVQDHQLSESEMVELGGKSENHITALAQTPEGAAFLDEYTDYARRMHNLCLYPDALITTPVERLMRRLNWWQHGHLHKIVEKPVRDTHELIQAASQIDALRKYITPHLVPIVDNLLERDADYAEDLIRLMAETPEWKPLLVANKEQFALTLKTAHGENACSIKPFINAPGSKTDFQPRP